jgi:hypothetical protein
MSRWSQFQPENNDTASVTDKGGRSGQLQHSDKGHAEHSTVLSDQARPALLGLGRRGTATDSRHEDWMEIRSMRDEEGHYFQFAEGDLKTWMRKVTWLKADFEELDRAPTTTDRDWGLFQERCYKLLQSPQRQSEEPGIYWFPEALSLKKDASKMLQDSISKMTKDDVLRTWRQRAVSLKENHERLTTATPMERQYRRWKYFQDHCTVFLQEFDGWVNGLGIGAQQEAMGIRVEVVYLLDRSKVQVGVDGEAFDMNGFY